MTGTRWAVLRVAFLVAVVAGAAWSWRSSGDELADALGRTDPVRVVVAGVLVLAGLGVTGSVWRLALASFGVGGRWAEVVPPFFVAQLGKYIPGSVWSFAAQGALAARRGLPARLPATAAVLFLGVHVASGLLLVGLLGWWAELPRWLVAGSLVTGTVGLVPAVHRLLGTRLAGVPCGWDLSRSVRGLLVMVPVWIAYAAALAVLVPTADPRTLLTLGCAFALAHAAGVAIPLAPAGLGAREAALVVLLAPVLGTGAAGALAVVARLLHALADFAVAGGSWASVRTSETQHDDGAAPSSH